MSTSPNLPTTAAPARDQRAPLLAPSPPTSAAASAATWTSDGAARERAARWAAPLALALLAFAVHAWIAFAVDRTGALSDCDVFFESDGNFRLTTMAHGLFAGTDVRHPNLGMFVTPFVRALTVVPRSVALSNDPDALYALREQVALLVSPLAGAVRTAALYRIARGLGAAAWGAVVVVLADLLAFGSLLLGSIPESFPLTAACTAVLCWFVLDDRPRSARRTALWVAVGGFAVGVTLTNAVTVGVLAAGVALRRLGPDWRAWSARRALAPARWVGVVLAGTVVVNGLGLAVTHRVFHTPIATSVPPGQRFLHGRPGRAAAAMAIAFGNTWLAAPPTVVPNRTHRIPQQPFTRRFSYVVVPRSLSYPFPTPPAVAAAQAWRLGLVWLTLVAGTAALAAAVRDNWPGRVLMGGVLALLAWNVGLHLVFGHEFLLYSQHWAPLMAVLLAGLAAVRGRWQPAAIAGLVVFTAVVAVDAPLRVAAVFDFLRTMQ